jgi:23S rRNA (cytosine1962-C5)-methyltransferase
LKKNPRLYSDGWSDYELIDAGREKKLERWGEIITIRPERQAYFDAGLSTADWTRLAHWEFNEEKGQTGTWKKLKKEAPDNWTIKFDELVFHLELTRFKHLGLFPEQKTNWDFIKTNLKKEDKFLNLFAYTGASSVVARACGAEVTHCDSMKQLVNWSNRNQESSQLEGIRWVVDDAMVFASREVKRGNKYKMIQMDPPAFGLGKKGQKWKLENKLGELLELAQQLLEEDGWLILNTYSPKLPLAELFKLTQKHFKKAPEYHGQIWLKTAQDNRMYTGDLIRIQKK